MAALEKLVAALDPRTNATLISFAKGTVFNQPINRPAALVQLPGADYGRSTRGAYPNPIGETSIAWEFLWPYDATYPTWTALRRALDKAIGGGRLILLKKQDPTGATQTCEAFCTVIPGDITLDTPIMAHFALTFQQLTS
jgi:hypothetical protein